MHDEQRDEYA